VVLKVVGIRVQDPAHPRHFSTTECGDIGGMRGSEPHAFRTWVQEVHIRDDAGGHSNCVPTRRCKMSAIFMTAKAMFERLYLIPGLVPICALCHHALGAHTPTAHALAISRILYNFFPKWPLNIISASFIKLSGPMRGYRDWARLLGESCLTKKMRDQDRRVIRNQEIVAERASGTWAPRA